MNEAAKEKREQEQFDIAQGVHGMIMEELVTRVANGGVGKIVKRRSFKFQKHRRVIPLSVTIGRSANPPRLPGASPKT